MSIFRGAGQDAFEQPFRTWDYTGFGPFVFDLEQYKKAIAIIPKL